MPVPLGDHGEVVEVVQFACIVLCDDHYQTCGNGPFAVLHPLHVLFSGD